MSSGSGWEGSAFVWRTDTNVMCEKTMPSDRAAAARAKSAEVMAALKRGDSKEADRLMGEQRGGLRDV
jgi:hypothetical protein